MKNRPNRRPRSLREFNSALAECCQEWQNGGPPRVYTMPDGRTVVAPSAHGAHNGDLSPGLRQALLKELVRYGWLALAVLAGLALAWGVG